MREEERIERICEKLKALWSTKPDLRFGQLLESFVFTNRAEATFYIEDTETERRIERHIHWLTEKDVISATEPLSKEESDEIDRYFKENRVLEKLGYKTQ